MSLPFSLLASLHPSLQCGRVKCIEWSSEDTIETVAMTKVVMEIIKISTPLSDTVQQSLQFI